MPSASVPPPISVLSAEAKHDPDLWLRVCSWLVVVFSLAQVLVFSFGRDQGIYGVVAEGILRGEVPYRDLWDFKPPGIFFVYASSFALFGKTMMAPRLVEVVMLFGAVLGLRRLGGVFFQSRTAGIMAGAIFALLHAQLDFWHTGQPESFAGPLTIYAIVLTTHPWSKKHRFFAQLATGILFGLAFLLKPPFGGGAIACAFYLSFQALPPSSKRGSRIFERITPFVTIGFASLVPIIALCLWFWSRGGWPALSWTLFEFAPGYTALSWVNRSAAGMAFHGMNEAFFGLSSLLALGTLAALTIHPRANKERSGFSLLLGILAFQLIGITIQGKFFQYHFGASIPLIALIAGQGYYKLWRRIGLGSFSGSLAFSSLVLLGALMRLPVNDTPGSFWNRSLSRMQYLLSSGNALSRNQLDERLHYVGGYNLDIVRKTAREITHHLQPGDYLYVWGFEPALYSLTKSRPSSRYIYNVPQRAQWQRARARRRLMNDLRAHPPQVVVTQKRDAIHFVTGSRLDSTDSLPDFPELQTWLQTRYKKMKSLDRFSIWLPIASQ